MATRGKNINLFLIDGNPNGRIKCSLSNWTGIVYKIPKVMINASKDIEALQQIPETSTEDINSYEIFAEKTNRECTPER